MAVESDDCESSLAEIESGFRISSEGVITDAFGIRWLLWDAELFAKWWRKLGDVVDLPLGRKLAFAALDVEKSILLEQLPKYKFWRKKRQWRDIARRWELMGWGTFHNTDNRIIIANSILDSLSAGLISAASEIIDEKTYRVRWESVGSDLVHVIHSKDNRPIPTPQPLQPWGGANLPTRLSLTDSGGGKLQIEDSRHLWIPFDIFEQLAKSGAGYQEQTEAMCRVFMQVEEQIIFADDWTPLFEKYLISHGHVMPKSVTNIGGDFNFELPKSEHLAVGILQACWQRINGRESSANRKDSNNVIITSKHEIVGI